MIFQNVLIMCGSTLVAANISFIRGKTVGVAVKGWVAAANVRGAPIIMNIFGPTTYVNGVNGYPHGHVLKRVVTDHKLTLDLDYQRENM